MLSASDRENVASEPSWFAKFLVTVEFKPFDFPTSPIAQPDTTNLVSFEGPIILNPACLFGIVTSKSRRTLRLLYTYGNWVRSRMQKAPTRIARGAF